MVKYFGLFLLSLTLFTVGCSGQKAATEEEATQGMEDIDSMVDSPDAGDTGAASDASAPEASAK